MKLKILILVLVFFKIHSYSQVDIEAKLSQKNLDNLIDIAANAINKSDAFSEDLNYLLLILKEDRNGKLSQNLSQGNFSISSRENKKIDSVKIIIQENELFKIYLFLKKNDQTISRDSLIISSRARKLDYIKEDEIEINGLIIENVKTKLGKDFYDYLYQKYFNSGEKYPFIIEIEEIPFFGRSSKVSIRIDDKLIFEFNTQPKDEYLFEMASRALLEIKKYSERRKFLYKTRKI